MNNVEKDCDSCKIKTLCLYSSLNSEQKQILNKSKVFRRKAKGSVLYEEGIHATSLFMVNSGIIKIVKSAKPNGRLTVNVVERGSMLGMESLQTNAVYKSSAYCVTDTEYCIIPKHTNVDLLRTNHKAREWYVNQYYQHLETLSDRMKDVISGDVGLRVAKALHSLDKHFAEMKCCIEINRDELAELAATCRETVSRTLTSFKKKSILAVDGKCIKIMNHDLLKKLSHNN